MRPALRLAAGGAAVAFAMALACGDVPTLPGGIAFITGVISPSLAVAAGDTLRDSLGRAAPLRVYAFGRANDHDTLPDIPVRFLVTTFDTGLKIDGATGLVVASDSIRAVSLLGQVLIDSLQTPLFTLQVVPQPDSLALTVANDSIVNDTTFGGLVRALTVNVTAVRNGTLVPVPFIVVRFDITRVALRPGRDPEADSLIALIDDSRRFLLKTPHVGFDTTDASGVAMRRVRVLTDGFDSVYVQVTAKDLKGRDLKGSPALHTLVRGF